MDGTVRTLRDTLAHARRVAVLTGAGISAASGLTTFRGAGGLWRNVRAADLATPEAYTRDPQTVWEWYFWRFQKAAAASPNRAHTLLCDLEARTPEFTLVTQNVDGLHRRAGSRRVIELHGNLTRARCEHCGRREPLTLETTLPPTCPVCQGRMRPNVVWFGETLPQTALQEAAEAFARAEVALVVGTSSVVEPAASLAGLALREGAVVIEINPERTLLSAHATHSLPHDAVTGLTLLLA